MADETYKLDELARAAGTSARTVRYYVQRGLLPAPAFRGKDTAYGREHLVRLRAIRRLSEAFLPLDAIAVELARRDAAGIARLAEGEESPAAARQIAAPAPSTMGDRSGQLMRRMEIAEGVEVTIAEDAPAASRALVERMLRGIR